MSLLRYLLWRFVLHNDVYPSYPEVDSWWKPPGDGPMLVGFRLWGKLRGVHASRYW